MRAWQRLRKSLGPVTAHNFLIDASAAGLFAIFQALTAPFVAVVAVRRGATPLEIGLIAAAPSVAMLLSAWYARLAERWSRVGIVSWCTGIARLFLLVTGWTHGMGLYLLSFLGFNVLSAASNPAYTSLERDLYHQNWRGRLMAGVRFTLGLCQFATMLVAGQLLDRWGAGPVFSLAVVFGLGSAAVFSRMREPARPPAAERRRGPGLRATLAGDPRLRRMLVAVMLAGGGNLLVQPGYPIYQVHVLHLNNEGIALLTAMWSVAWMVGYPLWGRLCDRSRPARAVAAAFLLYLFPPLCYALGGHLGLLLVASGLQGLGDSALDCGWQNHAMRLANERIDAYAGVYFAFLGMRGTVAPLLGAVVISRWGLRPLFLGGMALVASGVVVARHLPDGPLEMRSEGPAVTPGL